MKWSHLFAFISAISLIPSNRAAERFHFTKVTERSVALFDGTQPVFVYNHGVISNSAAPADRARSSYIHPLYGPDGEILTDDFPKDHYHHRGVFWAWPHVRIGQSHYDLWMLKGIEDRFERFTSQNTESNQAVLGVENGWFVGEHKVMREEVAIHVSPAQDGERYLDVDLTWIPTDQPITLEGAEDKSYGGLTIRFAPRTDTVITTPGGQGPEDLTMTRLPWADFSGHFKGRESASGAAIFVAPDHPNFPPEWLTRHYGALCPGWPGVQPKTFQPGETIRCRYRIWVHRCAPTVAKVSDVYRQYAAAPSQLRHSELWGANGEKWNPRSRLPDFSFAGYQRGEKALPRTQAGRSVKEFGAKGDGVTDDSKAFLDALEQVKSGALEIPEGRYKLSRIFELKRPGLVLRGAGPLKTALLFDAPLNDIKPDWGATTTGERTSNYSWAGGYFVIRGNLGSRTLTEIAAGASRGDNWVEVATAEGLRVGQSVEVYQTDAADNSLAAHLYSGDPGPMDNIKGRTRSSLVARIGRIDGKRVQLDRPLRCDIQLAWKPQLRSFEPTVTESGIEDMSFEFPDQPYKGHFTELGFNPIALNGVANCWVRNISIVNADSGIFVSGYFNTIDGVVFESARAPDRQKCVGHHGISVGGGDNLVTHFDFRARFIHDLTVTHCAGNVFSNGRGVDLSLDHHCRSPYENLFTDLEAGEGTRLWKCGGGAKLGYHCGARGTFWNIRARHALNYPPRGFGPASLNLVGLETDQKSETIKDGRWFEIISPSKLEPRNLHEGQRLMRLNAGDRH